MDVLCLTLKRYSNYKGIDYECVNEYVWEAYLRFYGGGPTIARKTCDLYSEEAKSLFSEGLNKSDYYNIKTTMIGNASKPVGV